MKQIPKDNKGLAKLPKNVRNKMGYMKKGGTPTFKTCPSCPTKAACKKAKKCKNRSNMAIGGTQSAGTASVARAAQSKYAPMGTPNPTAMGMKMKKGGYVNPVTIVNNLKKKK